MSFTVTIPAAGSIRVKNVAVGSEQDVQRLYGMSRALVYPSVMESMGLPLIEARRAALAVIAAELDYLRDVVDPEQSFDPSSAMSIARAIKRHLGMHESPLPMISPDSFVQDVPA